MNIKPLISEAKRLLVKNPRDNFHDLSHHQRVWENAQQILESIGKPVNEDVLKISVMWHDVMVSQDSLSLGSDGLLNETSDYLRGQMKKGKYDLNFQKDVLNAVKHHNFLTKYQMNIEGKILFDADKLDALNPVRYRKIIASIKNKKMSKIQTFLIAKAAKLWLRTMRNKYHFKVSKEIHDQLIVDLLKDKEAIQIAKEWGVDIVKLAK